MTIGSSWIWRTSEENGCKRPALGDKARNFLTYCLDASLSVVVGLMHATLALMQLEQEGYWFPHRIFCWRHRAQAKFLFRGGGVDWFSAEPIMSITGNQPKLRFRSEWLSEQEIPSPIAVDIENRTCAMYSKKMAEKKERLQTYRACAETNVM